MKAIMADQKHFSDMQGGSPDEIVRDLFQTEKEIASETLRLARAQHEREKQQWNAILAAREQEILNLKEVTQELEEQLKLIQKRLEDERNTGIEQLRAAAAGMDKLNLAERKKWDAIAEKVRSFRDDAAASLAKFMRGQEQINDLKRKHASQLKSLEERIATLEEEALTLKEKLIIKEEAWLRDKSRMEELKHEYEELMEKHKQQGTQK
ncbi:MAG: hypothetical protein A2219_07080 [Elusimicrobia bacterium RIFOXYA2_FULL_50_26]|nr:MAG: hypothetical protein A2219_07080 [Elusimicrobia bacterium RIFOXYA2_FULL_50_26]OGS22514.1 MAG: hypothetical protein A2314_08440 [Elusimicrobia bacterium RIFOXYB2_FULL_50_12]